MLVLTRKTGETINLASASGTVSIVVLRLNRGRVKLGFLAPAEYRIVRTELEVKEDARRRLSVRDAVKALFERAK